MNLSELEESDNDVMKTCDQQIDNASISDTSHLLLTSKEPVQYGRLMDNQISNSNETFIDKDQSTFNLIQLDQNRKRKPINACNQISTKSNKLSYIPQIPNDPLNTNASHLHAITSTNNVYKPSSHIHCDGDIEPSSYKHCDESYKAKQTDRSQHLSSKSTETLNKDILRLQKELLEKKIRSTEKKDQLYSIQIIREEKQLVLLQLQIDKFNK